MAVINKGNATKIIVAAAVAGAVTLLFVPQPGRKLRQSLWRKTKSLVGR
jgi:gas vesicle protein